tara:strand:- start:46 stop:1260 length:1215 start_codon:yes stop_codon:yes gene_type:complete
MKITYATEEKPLIVGGYHYAARCSYRVDGKQKRKYFHTKKDANEHAEKVRSQQGKFGKLADAMSERELSDAARIIDICKKNNWNPFEALDFYGAHAQKVASGKQFSEVVEFICKKEEVSGNSEKYIKQFQSTALDFAQHINGKVIDGVSKKNCLTYLEAEHPFQGNMIKWSNKTKNYRRSLLVKLFEKAKLHDLCHHNPVSEIPKYKEEERSVGYMDPKSIQAALNLARQIDPQMAVIYVLVFFCGLRLAEAARMSWEWIDLKSATVKVPKEIVKTIKRVVDIPDNALEWLIELKKEVQVVELVERKKELSAMSQSDLKLWRDSTEPELGKRQRVIIRKCREFEIHYPKNAVRHSYGTFHLALYGDIGKTATNMGNSPNMIAKHYDGECTDKTAAARFFSIKPE